MSISNKALLLAIEKGYRVDKHGDVYSKHGRKRVLRTNKSGYLFFSIRIGNNKSHQVPVHRLQALQKYGSGMFKHDCVRRLNGNKGDNSWENIAIGSIMDNWMDIPANIRIKITSEANQKYSIDTVKEIRKRHKNGEKMKSLMADYGITSKGTFSFILNKRVVNI